jgi:murein DD-endopeptidase MepM/ murein hydrolase activator NlpD
MRSHALGVFWAVAHRRPQDYAYFKALQPPVLKIQDGGESDYRWARENLPGALVVARDWAMGEQKGDMRRAPEETGRRHAREWKGHQARLGFNAANTLVLGINEPEVWIDFSTVPYTVAFLDECKRLGLRAGALQLSVGWPANTGPDTPPDWTPYAPVREAIKRGNHALVCHEYWADLGPQEKWGWWGGRTLRCPWDVPILIGECGFEMAVKKSGISMWERGWQAHINAETYAAQLVEYANRMAADPRLLGTCAFLSDFQNREWASLDVEPAYPAILARKGTLRPIADTPVSTEPPAPTTPQPPPAAPAGAPLRWPVEGAVVSQWYGENPDAYARFGLRGHNGIDYAVPVGTPVRAAADGTVAFVDTDPAYGKYVRVWHEALRIHTFYGHLSEARTVAGQKVKAGDVIALSGNTGNSTGPHLHYEIRSADAKGEYLPVYRMGKGAVDPVSFAAGLERGTGAPVAPAAGLAALIVAAATEFGVRPALLASLAWAESSFRADAVSPVGAKGLTQIMPATWAEWAPKVGAVDPFDARDNLRVGAAYLAWLRKQVMSDRDALHAYAWGIGRVLERREPPAEVRAYASQVVHGADLLEAAAGRELATVKVFLPVVAG